MIALRRLPLGTWGGDLFFVVSGFIMMYTTLPQFGPPGSVRRFAIKRLTRIVPTYWFFTSLMVFITIAIPASVHTARFTPSHALLSLLFVPHLAPERAESIEPLYSLGWTLNYEMFFYAIFTIAVLFKPRPGLIIILATFGLVFISARFGVWDRAFNLFWRDSILSEFLLGIVAFYLCRRYEPKSSDEASYLPSQSFGWCPFLGSLPTTGYSREVYPRFSFSSVCFACI